MLLIIIDTSSTNKKNYIIMKINLYILHVWTWIKNNLKLRSLKCIYKSIVGVYKKVSLVYKMSIG